MSQKLTENEKPLQANAPEGGAPVSPPAKERVHVLKLICVGFKEAPLDSPSFRSSVNYFHQQLETVESWIDQVIKSRQGKFKDQFEEFHKVYNQVCDMMLPPVKFLDSGVLDGTECTPEILTRFQSSLKQIIEKVFVVLQGTPTLYVSKLASLAENVIKPYKEARKNFDYYQSKYDSFLDKYQGGKYFGVDPSTIREDAFQLFEVREKYIHYSLDLVLQISATNNRLSEHLIDVLSSLKSENEVLTDNLGSTLVIFTDVLSNFNEAKHWFHTSIAAHKSLQTDILRAREQVEKSFLIEITPTRDIEHYNLNTVAEKLDNVKNYVTDYMNAEKNSSSEESTTRLSSSSLNVYEKSGWLYMKTTVGVPARTVWVKRWCFIKNSVFGMLVLAASKNYVQETDKFGVLLTKMKYNAKEERKFCFELQISGSKDNINIVLQADSFVEMESWFRCLAFVKAKLVSKNISKNEYELAFLRFPPLYTEYACSSSTSVDALLTTSENCTSLVKLCGAKWNAYGEIIFRKDGIFKTPYIATPIMSKLTKLSILAHNFVPGCDIPNAITANLWGSVNWCRFFLEDRHVDKLKLSTRYSEQLKGKTLEYPSYYPECLKNQDLQLKCLFPMSSERLVLRVDCALSPNDKQDFQGTCFFTPTDAFFYMNSTGFLSLITVNLGDLASFEIVKNRYISIYKISELVMKIKVGPDIDLHALVTKLNYLVENQNLQETPDNEEAILQKFYSIDEKHEKLTKESTKMLVLNDNKVDFVRTNGSLLSKNDDLARKTLITTTLDLTGSDSIRRREKLSQSATYLTKFDVPIEPQALMHLMFGENSICFPRLFRLYKHDSGNTANTSVRPWVHYPEDETYMREFHLNMIYPTSLITQGEIKSSKNVIIQKLNKLQDDYCEVETDHGEFQLPCVGKFKMIVYYVISPSSRVSTSSQSTSSSTPKRSVLEIYLVMENLTSRHSYWKDMLKLYMEKIVDEELHLMKQIAHHYYMKMGNHGQLIKAVKVGGRFTTRETQRVEKKWVDDRPVHKVHFKILLRMVLLNSFKKIVLYIFITLKKIMAFVAALLTNIGLINKFVLGLLILSGFMNLYLSGKSSIAFWRVRRASKMASIYSNGGLVMERALYLKDLDLLTNDIVSTEKDFVYQKFIGTAEYNKKYKDIRYEVAKRRNDLLVELKILSNMESEVLKGDFAQFLAGELKRCHLVETDYPTVWNNSNNTNLKEYCEQCESKYEYLGNQLL